jgi:hypothetical protein
MQRGRDHTVFLPLQLALQVLQVFRINRKSYHARLILYGFPDRNLLGKTPGTQMTYGVTSILRLRTLLPGMHGWRKIFLCQRSSSVAFTCRQDSQMSRLLARRLHKAPLMSPRLTQLAKKKPP